METFALHFVCFFSFQEDGHYFKSSPLCTYIHGFISWETCNPNQGSTSNVTVAWDCNGLNSGNKGTTSYLVKLGTRYYTDLLFDAGHLYSLHRSTRFLVYYVMCTTYNHTRPGQQGKTGGALVYTVYYYYCYRRRMRKIIAYTNQYSNIIVNMSFHEKVKKRQLAHSSSWIWEVFAWWNRLAKCFIICHIFGIIRKPT